MIHFEAVADADEPRTAQQEHGLDRRVRLPLHLLPCMSGIKLPVLCLTRPAVLLESQKAHKQHCSPS